MFVLLLLITGMLLHGYPFWRLSGFTLVRRHLALPALLAWSLVALFAFHGHDSAPGRDALFEQITVGWLVTLFLTNVTLLAVDLATGFGLWGRRWLKPLRATALLAGVVLALLALAQGLRAPQLVEEELTLVGLPLALDGTRVLFMSDLHLGSVQDAAWWRALVTRVCDLDPDLVLLGGDLFEGSEQLQEPLWQDFARLRPRLGTFAVTGNHEYYGDNAVGVARSRLAGVIWLHNRSLQLAPRFWLSGVNDLSVARRSQPPQDPLGPLLAQPRDGTTLLLSHSPLGVEEAAASGVALMLSGHTHCGQVWPFGDLVRLAYPWFCGHYQVGEMQLLVGRGAGSWGVPMRLWRPGEFYLLTLRSPAHP